MRQWTLRAHDPISLRIAADARLSTPNYVDDQIWELRIGGGEPSALALETSYGLRARSMRIFPSFRIGEHTLLDPKDFHRPPVVNSFLPNYLQLSFSPTLELEVVAEYWAIESHAVAGRFTLKNASQEAIQPTLLLHAVLRPGENPRSMSSLSHQGVIVLQGSTGPLAPLVFISGGATAAIAPYPALQVQPIVVAEASEQFVWVHAACGELQESFQAARDLAGRGWDAELARVEQLNAGQIEIKTGEPDWDAALATSQQAALASFVGPTRGLPHAAPVLVRSPSHGYSTHPDGRDHDVHWDGYTAAHATLILPLLLPAAPELAQGMLLNFLAVQAPDGSVDSKPGLGGQRGGTLSIPLLATLAMLIYRHTEDREFLKRVYARLIGFVDIWFDRRHDRDQDGHPEWDHTVQAGFDDWPAFVRWGAWGQGLDIAQAETPDLACYLFRELQALIEMQSILGYPDQAVELAGRMGKLAAAVDHSWNEKGACYLPLDRDLHHSPAGRKLGSGRGEFSLEIAKEFDPPVRVLARVTGPADERRPIKLFIHGKGRTHRKRVERLTQRKFQWFDELGTATTVRPYSQIERIEVKGLSRRHKVELLTPNFRRRDHTGLLPLWAGIADPSHAHRIIHDTLTNAELFWREYGVPSSPADDPAYSAERPAAVSILWNSMIGEGLVDHGYLDQAAELVGRLMRVVIASLKKDQAFREAYHADSASGMGERGHISGIAPLGLMLYVLGVRLITPYKVALRGRNPFPWPITLRWRGLEIAWRDEGAQVRFPDGGEIMVAGSTIQIIEQASEVIIPSA